MKKQIPAVLLAIVCVVLAFGLYKSKQENTQLQQEIAKPAVAPAESLAAEPSPKTDTPSNEAAAVVKAAPESEEQVQEEAPAAGKMKDATRRMMSSIAKMMENPTMNKVMEASQRGAVGALYSDLIEYLDLDAEETKYFMDLLMYRQMKQMDLGMKMMGGGMDEAETEQMTADITEASETVKSEMQKFLNNPDDFAEFEFYEKTMGERMMLAQMDQTLASSDSALSDETYRELLGMMHDERTSYDFSSNLHDEENMDLSAERFSKKNIDAHANDIRKLDKLMIARAEGMLTPDQFKAYADSLKTTTDMQIAQLEMVAQMLGRGEQPKAP